MKRFTVLMLALAALCLFVPAPAYALQSLTWVSSVGDDANPCTRTAPCHTFHVAISNTVTGGQIDCLNSGPFGQAAIVNSITIDCRGTHGLVLGLGTNDGIVINGANINVTIRGLDINGLNGTGSAGIAGIKIVQAGTVVLDHVRVFGFGGRSTAAIDVEPNQSTPLTVDITDTAVHHNTNGAILIGPTGGSAVTATLTRVNMYDNLWGLKARPNSLVTVFQSVSSNNTGAAGFQASSSSTSRPAEINLIESVAANNRRGILTNGSGAIIWLYRSAIVNNTIGITIHGGTVIGSSPHTTFNAGNVTAGAPNGIASTLQ